MYCDNDCYYSSASCFCAVYVVRGEWSPGQWALFHYLRYLVYWVLTKVSRKPILSSKVSYVDREALPQWMDYMSAQVQ